MAFADGEDGAEADAPHAAYDGQAFKAVEEQLAGGGFPRENETEQDEDEAAE